MTDVVAESAALAASEARLSATFDRLDDELAAGPSLLPGWTRAVVVRHIAVNARSNAQMIEAALRGEHRPQYPGGDAERTALIEWGRGRPAAEVVADARAAAAEFRAAIDRVGDRWEVVVPAGIGPRTIANRLRGRRFEVEVHHVDLDLGYGPRDWPAEFVTATLPATLQRMAGGPEPPPPGRWRIEAKGVGTWDVFAAEPVVWIASTGVDVEPRGTVSGEPAPVLAWLLGRGDAGALGLDVRGDDAVATLPRSFPYT